MRAFFIAVLIFALPLTCGATENDGRELLTLDQLVLVGGFKIPNVTIDSNTVHPIRLDINPTTQKWIATHGPKYSVVELVEPVTLGTGYDWDNWPEATVGRYQSAMTATSNTTQPGAAFWLSDTEVLVSGRSSYVFPGPTYGWITKVNMNTGDQVYYDLWQPGVYPGDYDTELDKNLDDFRVLQAFGAGFVRISGAWATNNANGNDFLLGRGGYDAINSPFGPAMGVWDVGSSTFTWAMNHPSQPETHPAKRPKNFYYPSLDPDTSSTVMLSVLADWQGVDENGYGYWQSGDVGGITYIDHPNYTGFLVTHNGPLGVVDYRAQGGCGGGKMFNVTKPSKFYSIDDACADKGGHQAETLNAAYPDSDYLRLAHVYSPDEVAEVIAGTRDPWTFTESMADWPFGSFDIVTAPDESEGNATMLGSVTWDSSRNYLWLAVGTTADVYMVAYTIGTPDPQCSNTPSLCTTEADCSINWAGARLWDGDSCELIYTVCNDSVLNGDETDVDCGGSCGSCGEQTPTTWRTPIGVGATRVGTGGTRIITQ